MKLTKKELSYLGKIYKNTNPLALFSSINTPLEGNEQKLLEEKGVIKGGKPTIEAHKLLSVTADPQRCTRLVLKDGGYFIEKYAYKKDEDYTLTENDEGEVILSPKQQLDEALFQLSQWVGMSDLKAFDLGVTLSSNELLVFLALTDIRREKELLSYLGKNVEGEISFTQILDQLNQPAQGSLTRILTGNYKYSVPETEEVKKVLEQLSAKYSHAFRKGYTLLDAYEEFGKGFLIPQAVIMLETFNLMDKKEISGAGVLCIWAGMREIVSFVFREGSTEVTSISGRQLLKMIENFLNCPDVI